MSYFHFEKSYTECSVEKLFTNAYSEATPCNSARLGSPLKRRVSSGCCLIHCGEVGLEEHPALVLVHWLSWEVSFSLSVLPYVQKTLQYVSARAGRLWRLVALCAAFYLGWVLYQKQRSKICRHQWGISLRQIFCDDYTKKKIVDWSQWKCLCTFHFGFKQISLNSNATSMNILDYISGCMKSAERWY